MKARLLRNLSNVIGWSTSRKIVVFESDDWGSIRMPSKAVYDKLVKLGCDLTSGDATRYNKFDTLASAEDLTALFETLTTFKDVNGNNPVFTAVSVVSNPDFEKIKANRFEAYFPEPFTSTLVKYGFDSAFPLWVDGIKRRLFVPQFHGREHLNVSHWLDALRQGDQQALRAFDYGCWGFNNQPRGAVKISYQAAFDFYDPADLLVHREVIADGLQLFEKLFGFQARFFVPPNGPFSNSLEETAARGGIKYMSASKVQMEPIGYGKTRRRFHYLGQSNRNKQLYITRNCFFEPSQIGKDWEDSCLNDIANAFKWRKPAVISSHRVNYIGGLDQKNRDNGLASLRQLLRRIINHWPTVEFVTSDDLGKLICGLKR